MNMLKMQISMTIPDPVPAHPCVEKRGVPSVEGCCVEDNCLKGRSGNRHADKNPGLIKIFIGTDLQLFDPAPFRYFLRRGFRFVKIFELRNDTIQIPCCDLIATQKSKHEIPILEFPHLNRVIHYFLSFFEGQFSGSY